MPTVLEICAGAGGLAIAFRDEGWTHIDAIEINAGACRTLAANLGTDGRAAAPRDATAVDFTGYEGVDVCAGGVPCQPFSVGGVGRGSEDTRDLWQTALRCVREARPRLGFVFENVGALVSKRHRSYFDALLVAFEELGYRVEWRLVCAPRRHYPKELAVQIGPERLGFPAPLPKGAGEPRRTRPPLR